MPSVRLEGRVAIVTGAGSGIGRAIAHRFASDGARVVAADCSGAEASTAAALGDAAVAVNADIADAAQVRAMVAAARTSFGAVHILCNNAAIMGPVAFTAEYDEDTFDRVIGVNLRGTFLAMKYAIPAILEAGGGSIVNISSAAGLVGVPGGSAYGASKAGVLQLTRMAAVEYAAQGIRVNAICPGSVPTPMLQEYLDVGGDETYAQVVAAHPIGRFGEPEEIASVAAFLASDDASFVTGAVMPVDGGYVAQ